MSALEADTAAVSGMSRILVTLIFCILISIQDIRAYRIPNELVYAFFLILFVSDIKYDYSGIIGNISAGVLIFLLFSGVRYFYGGLGGGDVKFGGVLGYTLGLRYSWLSFFFCKRIGLSVYNGNARCWEEDGEGSVCAVFIDRSDWYACV